MDKKAYLDDRAVCHLKIFDNTITMVYQNKDCTPKTKMLAILEYPYS